MSENQYEIDADRFADDDEYDGLYELEEARKLLEEVFTYFAESVYAGPSDLYNRIADFLGRALESKLK